VSDSLRPVPDVGTNAPGAGPDESEMLADSAHAPLDPSGLWANLERRIFATNEFFRLWLSQVVTSIGNWLFFFAIAITAARVGGGLASLSVGFVVAARIVPGLFLAQLAGVLADRWDRRKLMVVCDLSRAGVVLLVPFIDHVWQLVLVSLVMEAFTLLWIPAKEASVPNLIPRSHLTTANSLSVIATYGTVLVSMVILIGLAAGAARIEDFGFASTLRIDETSLSFYADSITYLISAGLISSLRLTGSSSGKTVDANKMNLRDTFDQLKEGWRLIGIDPVVRAVNVAFATALIGGGMVVPLGIVFAFDVLGAGNRGYVGMIAGLGGGAAVGVIAVSVLQERLRKRSVFIASVFGTGAALFGAATASSLTAVVCILVVMGFFAGPVYVIGFTLLHERVTDDLRGRVFASLYALVQICVLIALVVGPALAEVFDQVAMALTGDGRVQILGFDYQLPGERLALWLGSLVILGAGVLSLVSMRAATDRPAATELRSVA